MSQQQFEKKDNPTLEEERSSSIPVAIPTLLTSSSMLRPTLKGKSKVGVQIKGLPLYRNVTLLHGDDDALWVDEEGGAEGDVLLRLVDAILSGHHASWVGGEPHLQ